MIAPDPADYRAAANLIRAGGLAKRTYRNPETGGHCTIGALAEVTGKDTSSVMSSGLLDPLCQLLGASDPRHSILFTRITNWNDLDNTTEDDVILLLEQAAEKLEAG